MATRSAIAIKHGDKIKAVYCHWDGYLENNGEILVKHYNSVKANKLISLGDISSLREDIGEKHDFSRLDSSMPAAEYEKAYGNMTTFYGRDRGEENTGYKVFDTAAAFIDYYSGCGCEYYYILEGNEWTYSRGQAFKSVREQLELLAAEDVV